METKKVKIFLLLIAILLMFVSCSKIFETEKIDTTITDNSEAYIDDSVTGIKEVYVTVLEPSKSEEKYNYTLSQLNSNIDDPFAKDDPEVKIIFQEGVNGVINKDSYGYYKC